MGLFLTPNQLFRLAMPARILFGDASRGLLGIEPGTITSIIQTGAGSGAVAVDGIPRDAFSLVLKCISGGEINVLEAGNPGALPRFALSQNGGLTYSTAIPVTDNRDEAYLDAPAVGLRFKFTNGAAPSFLALTTYAFSTAASPDIVDTIAAVEADVMEAAAGSFDSPITAAPPNWSLHVAWLVRWELYCKMGIQQKQDLKVHFPKAAIEWKEGLRGGRNAVKAAALGVIEKVPGTSFTDFTQPPPPDPWNPAV